MAAAELRVAVRAERRGLAKMRPRSPRRSAAPDPARFEAAGCLREDQAATRSVRPTPAAGEVSLYRRRPTLSRRARRKSTPAAGRSEEFDELLLPFHPPQREVAVAGLGSQMHDGSLWGHTAKLRIPAAGAAALDRSVDP